MASTSISQPVAKTLSVVDLVGETLKGRIRIPEFQRPLRWQWEDVRRLFDSIVKGYPIGSVLLWIRPAPEATIRLGGRCIPARQFDDGWWVVDGQQRLTSLANALSEEGSRDDRFALAYDLEQQTFCHPSREDLGHIIPLPVLFDGLDHKSAHLVQPRGNRPLAEHGFARASPHRQGGLGRNYDQGLRIVLRKETVRPWASVRRPSSRIWSIMLKTSGWAFSISSNRTTV